MEFRWRRHGAIHKRMNVAGGSAWGIYGVKTRVSVGGGWGLYVYIDVSNKLSFFYLLHCLKI